MHVRTAVVVAALGALASGALANPDWLRPVSTGDEFGGPRGPLNYFAGFETVEGYTVGPIEPQLGWSASGTNLPFASVSVANPATGSQHLRIVQDPSVAAGAARVVLGPGFGAQAPGFYTSSVDVNISATGGGFYEVIGQAPSQGFITYRTLFNNDGTIAVLDDADGPGPGGLAFIATAGLWTPGQYHSLRVDVDGVNDTLRYYLDDVLIYDNPVSGVFAGSSIEQIGHVYTNAAQGDLVTGDFDNWSVMVPAPGAVSLAGVALLSGIRRRRRA